MMDIEGACGRGDSGKGRPAQGDAASPALESALRKAGWRLVPLTMAIAISNHMDRSK